MSFITAKHNPSYDAFLTRSRLAGNTYKVKTTSKHAMMAVSQERELKMTAEEAYEKGFVTEEEIRHLHETDEIEFVQTREVMVEDPDNWVHERKMVVAKPWSIKGGKKEQDKPVEISFVCGVHNESRIVAFGAEEKKVLVQVSNSLDLLSSIDLDDGRRVSEAVIALAKVDSRNINLSPRYIVFLGNKRTPFFGKGEVVDGVKHDYEVDVNIVDKHFQVKIRPTANGREIQESSAKELTSRVEIVKQIGNQLLVFNKLDKKKEKYLIQKPEISTIQDTVYVREYFSVSKTMSDGSFVCFRQDDGDQKFYLTIPANVMKMGIVRNFTLFLPESVEIEE